MRALKHARVVTNSSQAGPRDVHDTARLPMTSMLLPVGCPVGPARIAEITRQIGEVNEMFQDLAVLINDQGAQLNTIDVQISSTAERTREGTRELVKAERSQRAARNKCLMRWIVSGVVLAVILVIVFA